MDTEYEGFYQGFVLVLLASASDEYVIKSNREAGLGRFDLILKSRNKNEGIILEFKVGNKKDELESKSKEALEQIESKQYEVELKNEGITNIIKYGIAFHSKDCAILKS